MSIAARLQFSELYRSDETLDNYGMKSTTPIKHSDINIAISKNQPAHDRINPVFSTTEYVGITNFVGAEVGDIIHTLDGLHFQVTDIGDRGSNYQALFLIKI